MTLTIAISPPPKNANGRRGRHWARQKREKDRIAKEVWAQWVQAGRPKFRRVRVTIHRRGWSRVDPYAVGESVKPVLDALTERNGCGCIPDDSARFVEQGAATQEIDRRRTAALFVRLEEIGR